ncbi:ABC transporter substrate-binding protein [Phytohabitans kaempferiae]|uniref:ABC transporter substrate-binding protein n=1 Tax=Phytohabitans kaempferiae TaxID=1620943 RepID=A0ABV6LZQ6_9ACTN
MVRGIRLTAAVTIGALCATLTACGGDDGGSGSSDPFRIGAVAPLSGPYAAIGTGVKEGLELGAEEVNANGGILGRQVEVQTLDSAGDPARGLAAAQQLVERDKVDFVYPDAFPNVVLAILQYTSARNVLTVTAGATPAITEIDKYPFSFSIGAPFNAYDEQMAAQFKAINATDIGLLVTDDTSGTAFTAVWEKDFPAAGLNIKAVERYSPTATDVTATLQRLRGAGIQAIAFYGAGTQTSAVMQGIEALGWDVPVVAQTASVTGDLATLIPAAVQDQFRAVALRILGRSTPDAVDATFQPFTGKLKSAGPIVSLVGSAVSRDIVLLLKWAYEKAGSTDSAAVRTALESTGASPPDLDLLASPVPAFSATVHNMSATRFPPELLTVIKPSKPLDGTYEILAGS